MDLVKSSTLSLRFLRFNEGRSSTSMKGLRKSRFSLVLDLVEGGARVGSSHRHTQDCRSKQQGKGRSVRIGESRGDE